jgi:hypothetical protein
VYQQDEVQLDFVHLKTNLIRNFMILRCLPGGDSLYIDTALWAFRLTDGSLSLNNSAKRGITLQASIAWRPIEWPMI